MSGKIERIKFGMLLLFLALSLTLVLFYFRQSGYFDLMINFRLMYFFPIAIFILAQVIRAYRLFFLTRNFEKHFSKPMASLFYSESMGNLIFPYLKDLYAFFVGGILYGHKIKFLKTLLWLRVIDSIFLVIFLFCLKGFITIITPFMLMTFAIWPLISLILFFILLLIKKEKGFVKYLYKNSFYSFIQTVWIWLLEMTALGFFLNMSSGVFSFKEVAFNMVLNLTPIEGLHHKWFFMSMVVFTTAIFLLEGFRYLTKGPNPKS